LLEKRIGNEVSEIVRLGKTGHWQRQIKLMTVQNYHPKIAFFQVGKIRDCVKNVKIGD